MIAIASHKPDVILLDCGTLFVLTPQSKPGKEWVAANVAIEPYMRLGKSFACERRYVAELIDGMREAGLGVASA